MKRKIPLILIAVLCMPQFSCKDWLELFPPAGLTREEFWQTKEDVESVVMAAYTFMAMDGNLFKYGELRGDLITGGSSQSDAERKVSQSNIYPDNDMCKWDQFYQVIDNCNEVIVNAPLVRDRDDTFTEFQMQAYLSEAYWLRSLAYFYLVRIFKDVPLVLEPSISDDTDFYLPKTDGEEILRHMIDDLEAHRKYATSEYPTLRENKGRVTRGAYDALLADISLWLFDYEDVISHVNDLESSGTYVLMPQSRWFELYYPGNTLESIFEFQYDQNLNQGNGMYGLTNRFSNNYYPSQRAIELFATEFSKEFIRGEEASIKKYGDDEYIIWKYVGSSAGYTRSGFNQSSCNWIVYRYADVLLMKAEALSQLGRFAEATEILNKIRQRADVSFLNLPDSKAAYEDAIMEERALELAFEGKRWFDLLRMGRRNDFSRKSKLIDIIVQNVPSTQKRILATKLSNPLGWYLPIFDKELEKNIALEQNPYYKL